MMQFENWRNFSGNGAWQEVMATFLKGEDVMPKAILKLNQDFIENTMAIQQDILQGFERISESTNGFNFKDTESGVFQIWQTIYDKELSKFFQIPQLGLMRTYQEKMGRMMDKYNRFQAKLTEFTGLLSRPFKKSQKVLAERFGELGTGKDFSEKSQACYHKWVAVLEENYMSLFQSPEYITTLSLTVSALAEFIAVRDDTLEDILKFFPVARKSDMDDMARELYEIKKRLRKLEMASTIKVTT